MPAGYDNPVSVQTATFVCDADIPFFEVTTFTITFAGLGVGGVRERQHRPYTLT